ncbi:MAG: hypothetical protein KAW09_04415 [Thermoplasmata archaeon]|nr:hypothetical protein [Thermoplasmata archaeon]
MDREAVLRCVGDGVHHITYSDLGGCRFVDGRVMWVGDTSVVIELLDGNEISVLTDLVLRIEPFRPTGRNCR